MIRSSRTRLISNESAVEPDFTAGLFRRRSKEAAVASVAVVEHDTGIQAKEQCRKTFAFRERLQTAKPQQTETKEQQHGGWLKT